MKTFRTRNEYHVASRVQRLDARQQSRFSLALITLMSLATLSVMATTQALSAEDNEPVHPYSQQ